MITVDSIMTTCPCGDYPRERVKNILSTLSKLGWDGTWVGAATLLRDREWKDVSEKDLRLTAYRTATPEQRRGGVVKWDGLLFICQVLDEGEGRQSQCP